MNALITAGDISASSVILVGSVCYLLVCELNNCAVTLNTWEKLIIGACLSSDGVAELFAACFQMISLYFKGTWRTLIWLLVVVVPGDLSE
jgi:hypothetical protein